MRALTPDLDPVGVAEIDRRLAAVAVEHAVTVPWAVESGSRAWGFPSPDSDDDCRFLYVRPLEVYASPWPRRDVVETPLDAVFDVSGWDLAKAVRLAARGNATVGEWLRSPIVYDGDPAFRDRMLALVGEVADRAALARHYRHVGAQQWDRCGAGDAEVARLKGVLYALRPAATLHWMSGHAGLPPMNLQELLAEAPPDGDVLEAVAELVEAKSRTREVGDGRVAAPVRRFVQEWLSGADPALPRDARPADDVVTRAEAGFLTLVREFGPR
ncbi:nucleotidyltransferase domain-containing protein [Lapillicoccus jejuensis]|uniref:Nucleotidyltransferase n=1 Tax=Lapillicoccus jejuensis TaxID=402171 RepID=A0A542E3N0_9MICO|nr:nucleotidyltransferase domain-containing protein [Lapillicoccus jejuensis]TQJ09886.1 hypothetical protein FB458_3002 [Lapillicoccus jejuensis]